MPPPLPPRPGPAPPPTPRPCPQAASLLPSARGVLLVFDLFVLESWSRTGSQSPACWRDFPIVSGVVQVYCSLCWVISKVAVFGSCRGEGGLRTPVYERAACSHTRAHASSACTLSRGGLCLCRLFRSAVSLKWLHRFAQCTGLRHHRCGLCPIPATRGDPNCVSYSLTQFRRVCLGLVQTPRRERSVHKTVPTPDAALFLTDHDKSGVVPKIPFSGSEIC